MEVEKLREQLREAKELEASLNKQLDEKNSADATTRTQYILPALSESATKRKSHDNPENRRRQLGSSQDEIKRLIQELHETNQRVESLQTQLAERKAAELRRGEQDAKKTALREEVKHGSTSSERKGRGSQSSGQQGEGLEHSSRRHEEHSSAEQEVERLSEELREANEREESLKKELHEQRSKDIGTERTEESLQEGTGSLHHSESQDANEGDPLEWRTLRMSDSSAGGKTGRESEELQRVESERSASMEDKDRSGDRDEGEKQKVESGRKESTEEEDREENGKKKKQSKDQSESGLR